MATTGLEPAADLVYGASRKHLVIVGDLFDVVRSYFHQYILLTTVHRGHSRYRILTLFWLRLGYLYWPTTLRAWPSNGGEDSISCFSVLPQSAPTGDKR